ncbi:MATE family efflux transporter [Chloroflexota bacterium]
MKTSDSHRSDVMGRDSIRRLLVRFSGPAIVSMMVAASYNVVDSIFVGRLGPEALAALMVAFPLMMLFMAIATATGTGAASLISRCLGAGDREAASRAAAVTLTLTVLLGVIMTAICLPNLEAIMRLFGATGTILPMAKGYMSILVNFAVINLFAFVVSSIIRAEGNPILASAAMIASALINIALDPVLIFGLGPIPAMGVAGAATATVIGRSVGAVIFLVYFITKRSSLHFRPGYFRLKLRIILEIYRVGLASLVRMAAGSAVMVIGNRVAISFGVIPLAIIGVLLRSASFAFMPCVGLGQGVLPLVGYNFGAKQLERVGEVVIKSSLAGLIWGIACLTAAMLFPTQIISLFNTDPQFVAEGTRALTIFAIAFFTVGIQIPLSFFFQGIGRGLASLVLASSRQIIFLLPCLLILPWLFGLTGLWVAFPAANVLSALLTLIWTIVEFRKLHIPIRLRYHR